MCRHFDTGLVGTPQHLKTKYVKYSWFATTWHAGHVVGQYNENGVKLAADRNAFVLDHQHGCHDVTYKPAIYVSAGHKLINNVFVTIVYKTTLYCRGLLKLALLNTISTRFWDFDELALNSSAVVRTLPKKNIKLKIIVNRPFTSSKNSCL